MINLIYLNDDFDINHDYLIYRNLSGGFQSCVTAHVSIKLCDSQNSKAGEFF